jgi:hypothetical protein
MRCLCLSVIHFMSCLKTIKEGMRQTRWVTVSALAANIFTVSANRNNKDNKRGGVHH